MTSLRRRLDNVLAELAVMREALNNSSRYPFCCLKVYNDGRISCDVIGPLREEEFLRECEKCKAQIKRTLACIDLDSRDLSL